MAYTCVFIPSHECDGCGECQENEDTRDPRWDKEYDNDEEYVRELERNDE